MGYNSTYAGRGFAFETALHDAMLLLQEKEAENVLVGAFDEAYPVQYSEYDRIKYMKREKIDNLQLFESRTAGTLQGEGMAFFSMSHHAGPQSWCRLRNLHLVYRPADDDSLANELIEFLKENGTVPEDIDVLVNGISGDMVHDRWLLALQRDLFGHAAPVRFKHLTGEYDTASSFGLWLSAKILKTQTIPDVVLAAPMPSKKPLETVLVCNHFLGKYYSFFLLTRE
jgi:3-oxoacyl-(acyl-carrier-protein) synthase